MADTIRRYIKYTIVHLRLSGLYTDSDDFFGNRAYLLYSAFFNIGIIGLFNFFQIMYVLVNIKDTSLLLTHAYLVLTFIMPNVKAYFFLSNWPKIRKLLAQLEEEAFQPKNPRQVKIFDGFFRLLYAAHANFAVLLVLAGVFWPLIPVFGKKKRSLPYPYWTPFDQKRPVVFELLFVHQCAGIVCMMMADISLDMIFFGFTSYIASECGLLNDVLCNMDQNTEERLRVEGLLPWALSEEERKRIIANGAVDTLMSCIELHWKIIRFAKDVNEFFTVLVFAQFGSSLLSFCFTMYGFKLITSMAEMIVAAIFFFGLLCELLIYCYFGQAIITKSGEIGNALYSTPWVDCSKNFKRNILFFMLKVQNPIKVLALDFFEMALPTFVWILRCSWSFYTVLQQTTHE